MLPPLLWVSVAFLAGIVLAAHFHVSILIWLALALVMVVLLIMRPRFWPSSPYGTQPTANGRPSSLLVFSCLLVLFLGASRYVLATTPPSTPQVDWFNDRQYELFVTGTLVDPPDVRDTYTNLRVRAQFMQTTKDEFKVGGLLLARVPVNQTYEYGQIVRLRGYLQTPNETEDFSYRDYLARQDIHSVMTDAEVTVLPGTTANPFFAAVYSLKARLLDNVYRLFLDPEASLLAGILLGVDSGLTQPLQQAFKDTGTAHIIAISGFNIAIIAGVFVMFFNRLLGPRLGAAAAVLGIAFYTFLVGAAPAVLRAAVMGMLSLLALQVGRRQWGLNTLALVAAGMAAWDPMFLWDVGFQLSFFATLGLILYGTPFQAAAGKFLGRYFPASNAASLAGFLGEFVLLTLAAQLTTLPIMAYHFKQVSLVSFVANPFILPAQPAVMILGGLAVFASLIVFPLGRLLALVAWPLTAYTIRVVEAFDSLPHGVIYLGGFSLAFVVLFYAVLLAATFEGAHIQAAYIALRQRFRFLTVGLVLSALFICTLLTWRLAGAGPDGKLHVTFLDAGSSDAVLIQTAAGRNILIDGGPSTTALSDALGRRLSPLAPSIDWLVIASTDEQQMAALPRILPRFPPKNVLLGANPGASFSSRTVMQWLDAESTPVMQAEGGQVLDLGQGAVLKVLDVSTRGATLLVQWNSFRVLLPIGESIDTLDKLGNGEAIGPVDVLSLSQSGFAPLSPPQWIANLDPRLVVISVAAGDLDGRPDKETLDAVADRAVLRTDLNGWIDISTDGHQMWIMAERQPPEKK